MRAPRWACVTLLIAFLTILGGILVGIRWSSGWGIFIIGVGILEIVGFSIRWQGQFLKRAYQADGIVISHKKVTLGEGTSWAPIVRYTLPDGHEITFQSGTSGSRKFRPVSTKVPVLYDPNKPESAIINRPIEKYGIYLALLFAISIMAAGILILVGLIPGK